jgi:hypothetical protein
VASDVVLPQLLPLRWARCAYDHYKIDLTIDTVGDQTRRPGPGRASPGRDPRLAAATPHPPRAAEPGSRSPRTLPGAHHQPQGPQTALRAGIADITLLPETDPAQTRVGSAGTPAPPTSSPSPWPVAFAHRGHVFTVMTTWQRGRGLVTRQRERDEGRCRNSSPSYTNGSHPCCGCRGPRCSSTAESRRDRWRCGPA